MWHDALKEPRAHREEVGVYGRISSLNVEHCSPFKLILNVFFNPLNRLSACPYQINTQWNLNICSILNIKWKKRERNVCSDGNGRILLPEWKCHEYHKEKVLMKTEHYGESIFCYTVVQMLPAWRFRGSKIKSERFKDDQWNRRKGEKSIFQTVSAISSFCHCVVSHWALFWLQTSPLCTDTRLRRMCCTTAGGPDHNTLLLSLHIHFCQHLNTLCCN